MSLVYFLSKFSQEALLIELFLIGCLMTSYFGYVLTKKRRYGAARKNIPDSVVRAFLVEMISQAEGFKGQLFGDSFKIEPGQTPRIQMPQATAPVDTDSSAEIGLLKKQLAHATAKSEELSGSAETLKSEKAILETKLAQAIASAATAASAKPASGGGDNKALLDKIAKLEAKLSEYEVIEDDLANLKQYQQENKQLKTQLAALSGGAPALAAAASAPVTQPAPAAAPEPSPIAAAEEAVSAKVDEKKFEEPIAPPVSPVGASVADPIPAAAAAAPAPAAPPPAAAAPEAAPAAKKDDKTDSDLLNEFERMLNS
ncbi:MAG: hypothetical protein HYW49_13930 [Deltaproteobacteria bacterium]|nr:hypothetical protein [Deltaproteobacteria bacterium]